MANGNEETYEQMLALYHSTDLHEEQDRISRAMGSCKNVKVLEKVLAFAISDAVRSQVRHFSLHSFDQKNTTDGSFFINGLKFVSCKPLDDPVSYLIFRILPSSSLLWQLTPLAGNWPGTSSGPRLTSLTSATSLAC